MEKTMRVLGGGEDDGHVHSHSHSHSHLHSHSPGNGVSTAVEINGTDGLKSRVSKEAAPSTQSTPEKNSSGPSKLS